MDSSSLLSEFHRSLPRSPSHPPSTTVNPALLRRAASPASSSSSSSSSPSPSPSPAASSSSSPSVSAPSTPAAFDAAAAATAATTAATTTTTPATTTPATTTTTTTTTAAITTTTNVSGAGSSAASAEGAPPAAQPRAPAAAALPAAGFGEGTVPELPLPNSHHYLLLQSPFDFNPMGGAAETPGPAAAAAPAHPSSSAAAPSPAPAHPSPSAPLGSPAALHAYPGAGPAAGGFPGPPGAEFQRYAGPAAAAISHQPARNPPLAGRPPGSASPQQGAAAPGGKPESFGQRRFSLSEFLAPVHDPNVNAAMALLADSKSPPAVFLDLLNAPLTISEMSNSGALLAGQQHQHHHHQQRHSPAPTAPAYGQVAGMPAARGAASGFQPGRMQPAGRRVPSAPLGAGPVVPGPPWPPAAAIAGVPQPYPPPPPPPSTPQSAARPGGGPVKKKAKKQLQRSPALGASAKTFRCDVPGCDKAFKRAEHVKRHFMSVHSTEKREFTTHTHTHNLPGGAVETAVIIKPALPFPLPPPLDCRRPSGVCDGRRRGAPLFPSVDLRRDGAGVRRSGAETNLNYFFFTAIALATLPSTLLKRHSGAPSLIATSISRGRTI
ncbi:MAG: hypothetical protein BJ554DRAFT_6345 [Olpidium bornovanus]|uniref:C2H2-type domain-containing protein n=1 Tax=Olpidium bornovanus TaxID=278681 RepID=A0A8H7ZXP9_9FUNG|nr:MAG: hypothetical protein BJ554DRAFT_6345 [Olpidium bornovanus]